MSTFGLIGKRLGHSFSPQYFLEKFKENGLEHRYEAFEIATMAGFAGLVNSIEDLKGLNVTLPFKEDVIPFLDEVDETASAIGAVNTISWKDGRSMGHNTDAIGFERSLLEFIGTERPSALVLGSGGSSKAIQFVLSNLEIEHKVVSRSVRRGDLLWREVTAAVLQAHHLVVNATPLGMWPKLDVAPMLPYSKVTEDHYFFDLIYNPAQTEFLLKANRQGASTMNGKRMLELQAEASWSIWTKAMNARRTSSVAQSS